MALTELMHQWLTSEPLIKGYPTWVSELDAKRLASYTVYEQIYKTVPETFSLVSRGTEDKPIYIPAAKVIVETLHRYMAKNFNVVTDPVFGEEAQRLEGMRLITDLFRRERFYSKFSANKREGIFRGDWLWHIYADPERPEGSRINIFALDPASYFPIYNPDNIDEVIGGHIVEQDTGEQGEPVIRRLTYRKESGKGGPSKILVTDELYKVDEWGGPSIEQGKPLKVLQPERELPDLIDQLPIYHIQNRMQTGSLWGNSELQGIERILAAINQSISDEELALAMEGLGVYVTDAGTPVDDNDDEVGWNLGPGRVVEVPEKADGSAHLFTRVTGVSHVTPYQDHLKYLHGQLDQASGTPEIAKGRVDVSIAESGVAMVMEMGPMLARAEEGEQVITDVTTNMLYDLRKWFMYFEKQGVVEDIRWVPAYGDKLPPNRKQIFEEAMRMVENKVISAAEARRQLAKVGYVFPADQVLFEEMLLEIESIAKVEADADGSRLDRELEAEPDDEPEPTLIPV